MSTISGKRISTSAFSLSCALCAGLMQPAYSQDADDENSGQPLHLGKIVLSGDLLSERSSYDTGELLEEYGGNLTYSLRNTPGTFTRTQRTIPAIVVNIRGMQSRNRVVTLVESVPQTFSNMSGYTGTLEGLTFVNPLMLSNMSVVRGSVSGQHGIGSLSGAANFHFIEAQDILQPGRDRGFMLRSQYKNNGRGFSGMLSYARKFEFDNGAKASAVLALGSSGSSPHKDGSGRSIQDYLRPSEIANLSSDDFDSSTLSYFTRLGFKPNSAHSFEFIASDHTSDFLDLQNSRYFWDTRNRTTRLEYRFTPDNPLINLSFDIWRNQTEVYYDPNRPIIGATSAFAGRHNMTTTEGFSLSNRSTFGFGRGDMVLDYGFSWRSDEYEALNPNVVFGMNGLGELKYGGVFVDAHYAFDNYELSGGVNWMGYSINGVSERKRCASGFCDTYSKSEGEAWSGNLKMAYNFLENSQVYASVARTTRAPTVAEMFMPDLQSGAFIPTTSPNYNNLNLQPETSSTFEIGVRHEVYDTLNVGDRLTFEANYFNTRIKNWIAFGVVPPGTRMPTNYQEFLALQRTMGSWDNYPTPVRMNGVELSTKYESDTWFGSFTGTISDTGNQPLGSQAGIVSDDNSMPGRVATLEFGRYFMEGKLRVGARLHHVSDITFTVFNGTPGSFPPTPNFVEGRAYNLIDLYASYKPADNLTAYISIENLEDKYYLPFNASQLGLGNTAGRGRSITIGMSMQF